MAWRVAKSLEKFRSQVNARWPGRSKISDGTKGDDRHAASKSDHNPNRAGVVQAIDITNDPRSGCVSQKLAEVLVASRDPRIKYVISNRRICSGDAGPSPWKWRPYRGSNPHDKHVHLSVKDAKRFYDDAAPWSAISELTVHAAYDAPEEECEGCEPEPEFNTAAPIDKTVVTTRAAAGAVASVPVVGQVASAIVGDSSDVVDKITTVADQSGNIIAATKQVVAVPKPGFWNALLHVVTSPGFLIAVIIAMGLAWAFVWLWQRTHRGDNV